MLVRAACVLVGLAVFAAGSANGWGHVGHSAIAQLAVNRLTSEARAAVKTFMGPYHTLPQVAPYPDIYGHTPQGEWSLPLHYANLPVGAKTFVLARDCPTSSPCVVDAIMNYTKQLAAEARNPFTCNFGESMTPCALEFLTHFVGDVHQPLHVSFGCDRGGNTVNATFFDIPTHLHQVWDDNIIDKWQPNYEDAASELQTMINSDPSLVSKYTASMTADAWAKESFGYVLSTSYVFSAGQGDTSCCGAGDITGRLAVDSVTIGQWYYQQNLPIIKQRLIAAGIRLGELLNSLLVGNSTSM